MTCEESRRLISLYRAGERTDPENRALEEHLRFCPSCAKENEETGTVLLSAQAIASREPVLHDPEGLAREILAQVAGVHSRREHTLLDLLLRPAQRPAVRIAMASVILVAVGVFGIQSLQTLIGMQEIEKRFAHSITGIKGAHVSYEIDLSQVQMSVEQERTLRTEGLLIGNDPHVIVTSQMIQVAWSMVNRPIVSGTSKDLQKMKLDWRSLSQRLMSSSRAQLTLIPTK
jgi:hypothetical protein